MGKILIVHPNPDIIQGLRSVLEKDGNWIVGVATLEEASNRILTHRPDVVLLANQAAAKEAIADFRRMSSGNPLPVVLLIHRTELSDILKIFSDSGADGLLSDDDLIATEITNTVHNLLENPPGKKGVKRFLRYGHLELDRETRAARLGAAIVTDLPNKLFELLWLLSKRSIESKDICTRELIIAKLWNKRVRDRQVDVMISRLKTRVPFLANSIETIPGKGYRFALPSLFPTGPKSPENNSINRAKSLLQDYPAKN